MPRHTIAVLMAACCVPALWGCARTVPEPAAQMVSITGRLTYRERIALPPDTKALVELRETSADGPLVAERGIDLGGRQVPIPFELSVDRAEILAGRQYVVLGKLLDVNRPLWVSDPVKVEAVSERIDLGTVNLTRAEAPAPPALLQGTTWVVDSIDGAGLISGSLATLTFGADGRVTGSASCNIFTGRFTQTGAGVSFAQVAATMKTCLSPELMTQEALFLKMLPVVNRFELESNTLVLLTADGRAVIRARSG